MSAGYERLYAALIARVTFTPPPKPAEWIPANMYLTRRFAAQPGYISLELTPYVLEPIDMFADTTVRVITLCCASQVSKSMTLVGLLAYTVVNCDGQAVYALPTSDACDWFVQNRWKPIGEMSPAVKAAGGFERTNYKVKEQRFETLTVSWVGSNSPNQAAMRSSPFLFLDEIDKMASATDDEASFYQLIQERTKTFPLHKIVEASTPTVDTGNVWQSFLLGDQRYFHVPSPFAPDQPKFVIKFEMLKWDQTARYGSGEWNLDRVRASAYVECPYTGEKITNDHKGWMLRRGEWVATNPNGDSTRRSYHLSSFYSPWLTFGDVAIAFLKSHKQPDGLANFRNSWLGLPRLYRQKKANEDTFEALVDASPEYVLRTIPAHTTTPALLFMTVDVQEAAFYFVVRAYWVTGESALIDYGMVVAWSELENVFARKYPIQGFVEREMSCNIGMIDAGYAAKKGANVYGFCAGSDLKPPKRRIQWFPSFGRAPSNVSALATQPVVERPVLHRGENLTAIFYSDDFWKTHLYIATLGKEGAMGGRWWLPRDLCFEYKNHLSNEKLHLHDDGTTEWVVTGPQHLADCEKLQLVLEHKLAGMFKR